MPGLLEPGALVPGLLVPVPVLGEEAQTVVQGRTRGERWVEIILQALAC